MREMAFDKEIKYLTENACCTEEAAILFLRMAQRYLEGCGASFDKDRLCNAEAGAVHAEEMIDFIEDEAGIEYSTAAQLLEVYRAFLNEQMQQG